MLEQTAIPRTGIRMRRQSVHLVQALRYVGVTSRGSLGSCSFGGHCFINVGDMHAQRIESTSL